MPPIPILLIAYGGTLQAVGLLGFFLMGPSAKTALIGVVAGLIAEVLGGLALFRPGLRKHLMHAAALLVLLVGLPTAWRFTLAIGNPDKFGVAILLGINALASFVMLGVMIWSFIQARRGA